MYITLPGKKGYENLSRQKENHERNYRDNNEWFVWGEAIRKCSKIRSYTFRVDKGSLGPKWQWMKT